ncbi:MAG: protein TolR [Candidatus Aminicenantes bacterium RBG_16_63_14]|nr:MAG: protein TolR [Candidatus Aminicenantes bacterium RBG_16_63_14]
MALSTQSLPSSSRRRQVGTHLSEINVTPFVDVMLVLLVIFMVTAPMMQSGIGINLPQAETDSKPAEEGLTLTVTKDQYVHIGDSTININLLERRLTEYFYNKPKKVVYLQADKDLPFGFVVRVFDITKKAGIELVGVITEPIDVKDKKK